ncbi:hypothetical protein OC842_003409 [Tilletia horrida]|uniref:Uncharacterized protein n=1 Tax=Tilletia horrida TaxID=155126 RepID=A0AAN6GCW8_9BASI|nr:hypothetical protein OC842_003409 [Tilletia horrida]
MYSSPHYVSVPTAHEEDIAVAPQRQRPRGPRASSGYESAGPQSQYPPPQHQHQHQHNPHHAPRRSDHSQLSAAHPSPQQEHTPGHAPGGRPTSSFSAFDPLGYRGPSAYDHLPLSKHSSHASSGYFPSPHHRDLKLAPSLPYQHAPPPRSRGPWILRPWYSVFEAPSLLNTALLLFAGAFAYALVWIVPMELTKRFDMSLYWARAIVTAAINIAALIISFPLSEIAHTMLYSAIWTAVILEDDLTLQDLDLVADRIGVISGLRLLWIKLRAGVKRMLGINRRALESDKASLRGARARIRGALWGIEVPASLGILFLIAVFSFAVDRTIKINIELKQRQVYDAISVAGDLSDTDIFRAKTVLTFFDDYVRTWTLQSTAALKLPSTVKLALPDDSAHYAYFTEVESDYFSPTFEGYGSFSNETHTDSQDLGWSNVVSSQADASGLTFSDADGTSTTQLRYVEWPRWGIQARCQRLDNLGQYLVPDIAQNTDAEASKRLTALFLTHDVLSSALGQLNVALPSNLRGPANLNLSLGDLSTVLPGGLNAADIGMAPVFFPNGVAQSYFSSPIRAEDEIYPSDDVPDENKGQAGSAGRGWVSLEVVLVRLKPDLAGPAAQFGLVANVTDNLGNFGNVGFDAAICVERFDPYVVQVYQGRSIQSTKILRQAADFSFQNDKRGSSRLLSGTTSHLNSTTKYAAYAAAHGNARNALLKDNGRDASWVPNPTLTSMSSGGEGGPAGYGTLDPERLADMLASADTRLLLPYLVGNGKVEARSYEILPIARVTCVISWLNIVMATIMGCALAGILFVPRLPGGLPRRTTSPISWLAAFSGLRIGDTPANAVFATSGSNSAHASRFSLAGGPHPHGSPDPDSDEQRLLHRSLTPTSMSGGSVAPLHGGPLVTLEEIEKRLGKKTIAYALPDDFDAGRSRTRQHHHHSHSYSHSQGAGSRPPSNVISPYQGFVMDNKY